jgi:tetratricopeptide (TPR) repeat protein
MSRLHVTGTELGLYLQGEVALHVRQTPQFGKITDYELSRGDFVFELADSPTVAATPPDSQEEQAGVSGFLEQLEEKDRQESANWEKNLEEMQESYDEIEVFSQRDDISKDAKIEAWQYFMANYAEDNTYSQQDEELRNAANRQLSRLEKRDNKTDTRLVDDTSVPVQRDGVQSGDAAAQQGEFQISFMKLLAANQQKGTSKRAKIKAWQEFLESAKRHKSGDRAVDKDLLAAARRNIRYIRAGRVTDDKQTLRRRGAEYARNGRYGLAIQEYSWLIEADPRDADAHLKRASALQHRGQLNPALRDYTKALELNPKLVHAYFGRASIYRAKGNSEMARKELLKLARLDRRTIAAANLSDEQLKTLRALQKAVQTEQNKKTSSQRRKQRKF